MSIKIGKVLLAHDVEGSEKKTELSSTFKTRGGTLFKNLARQKTLGNDKRPLSTRIVGGG